MGAKRLMTAEDLWALPEKPGVNYELVDGEPIEVPGASPLHGLLSALVLRLIGAYTHERDLGLAFGDGTGYILRRAPDVVRIPDVSFVSWARVPEEGVPEEGYWPFAPDLAVEIVSPGDRANDVHDKVREYLAAGAAMVWVLWPRPQSATVYGPDGVARELGPDAELDGGDVLPGFRVRVRDLFAVRRRR
jgi:Uma2 family endonuclease